jgi:hypothetical protein
MANTINVAIISTANTFNQWRINDNLVANDVNEITRGNFVKPRGNVTINEGYLRIANTAGGVILDVADDTNIDGTLTVFNVELDNSTNHLYVDAGDIHYRRMGATDLYQINTNTVIYATNVSISNATVGGTFNVSSNTLITASNVVTFNVESNTTISSQKVRVSNTTADARFNVSPNTYFFGNHVNVANTHGAATFEVTPNTFIFASANVSYNVNAGGTLEATGNANLYSNLGVTWNTFTGNAFVAQNTFSGNLAVTQNTSTGNLVVSQNSSTGNLVVAQNTTSGNLNVANYTQTNNLRVVSLANISNANLINATITTLTVIDPIQAPATTADDKYILRFGATTDGNATIRVQRSVASGNAELFWNDLTDTWNFLANGLPATLNAGAINTSGNITGTMKSVKDYLFSDTVSGTVSANLANSNWFKYTLSNSTTFRFENAPPSGTSMTFTLVVIQGTGGGKSVSWGNTVYWAGGQVPPATTTSTGSTDLWTFTTYDGGATYIGTLAVKDAR